MLHFLSSNIVLVQALISAVLLSCVFYLLQWLAADFIISYKHRENMKELGDLILTSALMLFIVSSYFPKEPVVAAVTASAESVVKSLRHEAVRMYKVCTREIIGVGKHGRVLHHRHHLASVR